MKKKENMKNLKIQTVSSSSLIVDFFCDAMEDEEDVKLFIF